MQVSAEVVALTQMTLRAVNLAPHDVLGRYDKWQISASKLWHKLNAAAYPLSGQILGIGRPALSVGLDKQHLTKLCFAELAALTRHSLALLASR